ncbi:unnamed protein product [Cochlearia groenlandica]
MSSIGASYAPVHLMEKKLKDKLKKRQDDKDAAQSLSVETSFATGRTSNKIYPSRSSYNNNNNNNQETTKSQDRSLKN